MENRISVCRLCARKSWRTYVPSLREDYAEEEDHEEDAGANPSIGCVGGAFVELGLVYLQKVISEILFRRAMQGDLKRDDFDYVLCLAVMSARSLLRKGSDQAQERP